MKRKKVGKKEILYGALASVMVLLSALGYGVHSSEKVYKMEKVLDGDTVEFSGGKTVRLLGINTEESGDQNASLSAAYLRTVLSGKNVWLEYDRYGKDRYGRDLAWAWVGCESTPKFMASDFMIKTRNSHNEGLRTNPIGCMRGVLVNEQVVKMGWSKVYFLSKKGEMKYERRLYELEK